MYDLYLSMMRLFTLIWFGFFFSNISAQQLSNGFDPASATLSTNLNTTTSTLTTEVKQISANSSTAVENLPEAIDIRVFPNPATSKLRFNVSDRIVGHMVRIFSVLGSEVMSYELVSPHDAIEVSTLQEGIYLYRIMDKNEKTIFTGKFNKE